MSKVTVTQNNLTPENFSRSKPDIVATAITLLSDPATIKAQQQALDALRDPIIKCGIGALSVIFENKSNGQAIMVQGGLQLDRNNAASLNTASPLVAVDGPLNIPNNMRPDRFPQSTKVEGSAAGGWDIRLSVGVPQAGCTR